MINEVSNENVQTPKENHRFGPSRPSSNSVRARFELGTAPPPAVVGTPAAVAAAATITGESRRRFGRGSGSGHRLGWWGSGATSPESPPRGLAAGTGLPRRLPAAAAPVDFITGVDIIAAQNKKLCTSPAPPAPRGNPIPVIATFAKSQKLLALHQ